MYSQVSIASYVILVTERILRNIFPDQIEQSAVLSASSFSRSTLACPQNHQAILESSQW